MNLPREQTQQLIHHPRPAHQSLDFEEDDFAAVNDSSKTTKKMPLQTFNQRQVTSPCGQGLIFNNFLQKQQQL